LNWEEDHDQVQQWLVLYLASGQAGTNQEQLLTLFLFAKKGDETKGEKSQSSHPLIPPGIKSLREFGEFIGWGKNGTDGKTGTQLALERLASITANDIQAFRAGGLTADMARAWANFYEFVHATSPGNPSAAGRQILMQAISEWLR
jgi:hypothetical protein